MLSDRSWRVGECAACGMCYLINAPDQSSLMNEHTWENARGQECRKCRKHRKVYDWFSDGIKNSRAAIRHGRCKEPDLPAHEADGARVLNADCWNALLRSRGWRAGVGRLLFPSKWRMPASDNMWMAPYNAEK